MKFSDKAMFHLKNASHLVDDDVVPHIDYMQFWLESWPYRNSLF